MFFQLLVWRWSRLGTRDRAYTSGPCGLVTHVSLFAVINISHGLIRDRRPAWYENVGRPRDRRWTERSLGQSVEHWYWCHYWSTLHYDIHTHSERGGTIGGGAWWNLLPRITSSKDHFFQGSLLTDSVRLVRTHMTHTIVLLYIYYVILYYI